MRNTRTCSFEIIKNNTNSIQAVCTSNNILIITLSSWKCAEIGISDADIYIEFLHSESDPTASEMSISWLPIHAAEHEAYIVHLSYPEILEIFGSYSPLKERCQLEKLINWIAKKSARFPSSPSFN